MQLLTMRNKQRGIHMGNNKGINRGLFGAILGGINFLFN